MKLVGFIFLVIHLLVQLLQLLFSFHALQFSALVISASADIYLKIYLLPPVRQRRY